MRLLALLAFALLAQSQTPDPIIKVDVNLIQIDVSILDKSGTSVPGLEAKDFEVTRDGKRLPIQSALYIAAPPAKVPSTAATPIPGKQLTVKDVRRTFAIYIDDLSISFENLRPTRDAIKSFIEKSLEPGDVVAIYRSSGGLGLLEQFTTDKRAMLAAVDRIRFRNYAGVDTFTPFNPGGMAGAAIYNGAVQEQALEIAMNRFRRDALTAGMLSTANFIVRGLRELPGRKSLVIFSESMAIFDSQQIMAGGSMPSASQSTSRYSSLVALTNLIDMANRSGVTIYTLDPHGLINVAAAPASAVSFARGSGGTRMLSQLDAQSGMSRLAEETGGRFFYNTNDLSSALTVASKDQNSYYLLAFTPDVDTFEKYKNGSSKVHKLAVKVHRSGLQVRHRRSFIGATDAERIPPSASPLAAAMTSPFRSTDLGLKLTPIYMEDPAGPTLRTFIFIDPYTLQFTPEPADPSDKDQTPWQKAIVEEMVTLFDVNGEPIDQLAKVNTFRLRGSAYKDAKSRGLVQAFAIPLKKAGPYQLRAAILDRASNLTGSAAQFVFVPDLKSKQLAMSDIAVSSNSFLAEKTSDGAPGLRVLHPGEQLIYGAYIYNAQIPKGSTKPNLEYQVVLYLDGKPVYTGPISPFQPAADQAMDQPLSLMGNMKLSTRIEPGEYVLQIAIRDLEAPKKQQSTVRAIDFEVRP